MQGIANAFSPNNGTVYKGTHKAESFEYNSSIILVPNSTGVMKCFTPIAGTQ